MAEAVDSFRMILPPDWVIIPAGDGAHEAVAELVEARFDGLPNDKYGPIKHRLAASLVELAADARRSNAVDLIFPVGRAWQVPVSAGVVMSMLRSAAPSDAVAGQVLHTIAESTPDGSTVQTKAGLAVREQIDSTPQSAADEVRMLRQVHHTWQIPGKPGSFLIGTLSISGTGDPELDPVVDALTGLVDLMMETLVWTYEDAHADAAG